jgi:hypothetical protein
MSSREFLMGEAMTGGGGGGEGSIGNIGNQNQGIVRMPSRVTRHHSAPKLAPMRSLLLATETEVTGTDAVTSQTEVETDVGGGDDAGDGDGRNEERRESMAAGMIQLAFRKHSYRRRKLRRKTDGGVLKPVREGDGALGDAGGGAERSKAKAKGGSSSDSEKDIKKVVKKAEKAALKITSHMRSSSLVKKSGVAGGVGGGAGGAGGDDTRPELGKRGRHNLPAAAAPLSIKEEPGDSAAAAVAPAVAAVVTSYPMSSQEGAGVARAATSAWDALGFVGGLGGGGLGGRSSPRSGGLGGSSVGLSSGGNLGSDDGLGGDGSMQPLARDTNIPHHVHQHQPPSPILRTTSSEASELHQRIARLEERAIALQGEVRTVHFQQRHSRHLQQTAGAPRQQLPRRRHPAGDIMDLVRSSGLARQWGLARMLSAQEDELPPAPGQEEVAPSEEHHHKGKSSGGESSISGGGSRTSGGRGGGDGRRGAAGGRGEHSADRVGVGKNTEDDKAAGTDEEHNSGGEDGKREADSDEDVLGDDRGDGTGGGRWLKSGARRKSKTAPPAGEGANDDEADDRSGFNGGGDGEGKGEGNGDPSDDDDDDEDDVHQAVSRIQAIIRSRQAREQYLRLRKVTTSLQERIAARARGEDVMDGGDLEDYDNEDEDEDDNNDNDRGQKPSVA